MPIFFMLPFIILQGMIDVAFDDLRVKARAHRAHHALRCDSRFAAL